MWVSKLHLVKLDNAVIEQITLILNLETLFNISPAYIYNNLSNKNKLV